MATIDGSKINFGVETTEIRRIEIADSIRCLAQLDAHLLSEVQLADKINELIDQRNADSEALWALIQEFCKIRDYLKEYVEQTKKNV